MKIVKLIVFSILILVGSSCQLDDYSLPAETLKGHLYDADGKAFISEQPNGFQIQLYEGSSINKLVFWGKPDGTFQNTKLFKGKYTVEPVEGAFFPVEKKEVTISGVSIVDFEVIPFLYIDATIVSEGKNIKATYKIKQSNGAAKILKARLLVSKWNPNVGMNYNDYETQRDLSAVSDVVIGSTEYIDYVNDIMASGVTYYARVVALSDNSAGRYNLSPVTKIVIP